MGGREHEYNKDTQPTETENEVQSGELAKGEEKKLPSGDAPKKSPFLEALVQMNMQRAEIERLREQLDKKQETDKEKPEKKAPHTPKYNFDEPPKSQIDDLPKLPEGYVPELSPLLEAVSQGMLVPIHVMAEIYANEDKELAEYIARRNQQVKEQHFLANKALLEENEQLRAENKELAEKVERHLQQARDSYARQRQENLTEYRAKRSKYMREYRARKKLEAESHKPPEEEDDSSQFS